MHLPSFLRSRRVPIALALIGVGVSVGVYLGTSERDAEHAQNDIAKDTDARFASVAQEIETCTDRLRSLAGMLALQPQMDASTFRSITRSVLAREPEIGRLIWAAAVSPTEYPKIRYSEDLLDQSSASQPAAGLESLGKPLARARHSGQLTVSNLAQILGPRGPEPAPRLRAQADEPRPTGDGGGRGGARALAGQRGAAGLGGGTPGRAPGLER